MFRPLLTVIFFVAFLFPSAVQAQQADKYKSFNRFAGAVPYVDFFASKRQSISPYVKPATETIRKLQTLLGDTLPKGAILICSSLEQKDSIYEPMILKLGYKWSLTVETPDVAAEEMLARIKSRMGDEIPAEIMDRMKSRQSDMVTAAEGRMVDETVRQIAYAVIQTTFAKNLRYRSSRLNDMSKSPLPDWMDIGIASYVTGNDPNLSYLQENMEQTFPIEDVLSMSRPFVASTFLQTGNSVSGGGMFGSRGGRSGMSGDQGFPSGGFGGMSGGQGFPQGGFGSMSGGQGFPSGGFGGMSGGQGFPEGGFGGGSRQGSSRGNSGSQGRSQRTIPKDEQDQMLFDGQSSTFFTFLLEKVGIEKVRDLIKAVQGGIEGRDVVARPDMLGDDFGKIEDEWIEFVEKLKPQRETFGKKPPPKQD
jgi:hypothetical protein